MHSIIEIKSRTGYRVNYETTTHRLSVQTKHKVWEQQVDVEASFYLEVAGEVHAFTLNEAKHIEILEIKNGLGEGIKTIYSGWACQGGDLDLQLETYIWVDDTDGHLHMEIMPICEEVGVISELMWPVPFVLEANKDEAYTTIPMMQGCLLPSNWSKPISVVAPERFYERAAYMPWWGQLDEGAGYMAIVETPWDSGYQLHHEQDGDTRIALRWDHSLGKLGYSRKVKYIFVEEADYNSLCKLYRHYIKDTVGLVTLKQKEVQNPHIKQLIGSGIVHECAYTHIEPKSRYYNHDNPATNDRFVTFHYLGEQLEVLKASGIDKVYMHLDGWGKRGYDNLHPDVFPPSQVSGGWEGLRALGEKCNELGYLFGIHDQYRDYYMDGETFTIEHGLRERDGSSPTEDIWYGGDHTWLCAQMAPYYVKRNYQTLLEHQIPLQGTYLDVFSVVFLDECYHKEHPMTRKDCMEKRKECFEIVRNKGLIVSSEELVDWAIPSLDLCHHAPYAIQSGACEGEAMGIPVPLLNLVYHDCIVTPWSGERGEWGLPTGQHFALHALLNGGVTYVAFESDAAQVATYKLVSRFHEEVAYEEMLRHEFVDGNPHVQRTYFTGDICVTVDFVEATYHIETPKGIRSGKVDCMN